MRLCEIETTAGPCCPWPSVLDCNDGVSPGTLLSERVSWDVAAKCSGRFRLVFWIGKTHDPKGLGQLVKFKYGLHVRAQYRNYKLSYAVFEPWSHHEIALVVGDALLKSSGVKGRGVHNNLLSRGYVG